MFSLYYSLILHFYFILEDSISRYDQKRSRELAHGLVSFLRTEAFYTIRRLLSADQKDMYDKRFSAEVPFEVQYEKDWKIRPCISKGGLSLTSYLTYGW